MMMSDIRRRSPVNLDRHIHVGIVVSRPTANSFSSSSPVTIDSLKPRSFEAFFAAESSSEGEIVGRHSHINKLIKLREHAS